VQQSTKQKGEEQATNKSKKHKQQMQKSAQLSTDKKNRNNKIGRDESHANK
jgi:hypothetical protein